jgi:hypothetical protein
MAAEGFSKAEADWRQGHSLMGPLADPLPHDEAHRIARRLSPSSPLSFQTNTSLRRKRGGAVASFSTTCAMAGARPQSAPIHREPAKAFLLPRRSLGPAIIAGIMACE